MGSLDSHCPLNIQVSMATSLIYLIGADFSAFKTEVSSWISPDFWFHCEMELGAVCRLQQPHLGSPCAGIFLSFCCGLHLTPTIVTPFQGFSHSIHLEDCGNLRLPLLPHRTQEHLRNASVGTSIYFSHYSLAFLMWCPHFGIDMDCKSPKCKWHQRFAYYLVNLPNTFSSLWEVLTYHSLPPLLLSQLFSLPFSNISSP